MVEGIVIETIINNIFADFEDQIMKSSKDNKLFPETIQEMKDTSTPIPLRLRAAEQKKDEDSWESWGDESDVKDP